MNKLFITVQLSSGIEIEAAAAECSGSKTKKKHEIKHGRNWEGEIPIRLEILIPFFSFLSWPFVIFSLVVKFNLVTILTTSTAVYYCLI
jgi:hypothetical protein